MSLRKSRAVEVEQFDYEEEDAVQRTMQSVMRFLSYAAVGAKQAFHFGFIPFILYLGYRSMDRKQSAWEMLLPSANLLK